MFKNLVILILIVLVFALFYFIVFGSFCHCSEVYCPLDNNELRSYFV